MHEPDVDLMLSRMTSEQFGEWRAFWTLEPFGPIFDWFRTGQIVSMIANTHLRKGARSTQPADFMPSRRRKRMQPQTLDQMRTNLQAIMPRKPPAKSRTSPKKAVGRK